MGNALSSPIGVIISTYNKIDDLNLVIEGYRNQTDTNFILYIADDGSTSETADFLVTKAANFPVPIQHIWHEDNGFRLSAIRNKSIHQAKTPYIIITDGDCIPLPDMVATHRRSACLGSFITGGRLLLSEKLSTQLRSKAWPIQQENIFTLIKRAFKGQINRITPLLLPAFCSKQTTQLHGIRGCHLAFWHNDLLKVNGFDESYEGWGREDSDIAARLFHSDITRRNLRGMPLLHLWHPEAKRSKLNSNDALLATCIQEKRIVAVQGITKVIPKLNHPNSKYNKLNILQICRRFGPVGGMERYVWELSHELASLGHQVHVLCEVNLCTEPLDGVNVHELGAVRAKPRWLAHIRFSRSVHTWIEQYATPEMIVHSHERTQDHYITTFHGPPFAQVRDLPFWKRFSLRSKMNLWLEERELCGAQVQIIVPNSMKISAQLEHYYPTIKQRLTSPILPGVTSGPKRPQRSVSPDAGVIGFIGKEWKRKGLEKAIQAVEKLAKARPKIHFLVAGAAKNDIQHLFKNSTFKYSLLGEVNANELYPQLDVLLHPANNEPYGMVITEALSAGVPVVISDVCGAASEVSPEQGNSLSLVSPIETWADKLQQWLDKPSLHIQYQHSWRDTAIAYIELYQKVKHS